MAAGRIEGVDRCRLPGAIRLGRDEEKSAILTVAIFTDYRFFMVYYPEEETTMAVFKRKRAGKDGKAEADGVWTVQITDHAGVRRRIPGFASRAASMELERNIRKLVSIRQAGGSPDAESNRFLETAPEIVRNKLAAWGVIAGERAAAGKALAVHIEDWRLAMEAKGNCADHIKNFVANLKRVSVGCNWRHLSDISASPVVGWMNAQKGADKSFGTINHHLRAAKAFCGWLVKERRMAENPLAHIALLNAKADRRLERRALAVAEIGRLLAAAEAGEPSHGMTGADRALLYRFALETGFRWSECCSLTRASFDFEASPATVTIRAESAKNRKEDTLPLRPELAADLNKRMALFLPTAKAFPGMRRDKGAKMLRVDLEAAGIPATDEYGRVVDFHSLRHTFGTLGAKAGIPLATMQKLMRHSDPKLTAGIYTHVLVADKADELAKLPELVAVVPEAERIAKTGTADVAAFSQLQNLMDTSRDTLPLDSDGKVWTYVESAMPGLTARKGREKTRKSPVSQGETGLRYSGDHDGTRTRNLQIDSLVL